MYKTPVFRPVFRCRTFTAAAFAAAMSTDAVPAALLLKFPLILLEKADDDAKLSLEPLSSLTELREWYCDLDVCS